MRASTALVLALVAVALPALLLATPAGDPTASRRIVALGDAHGDAEQLRTALVMAQLVDNSTGRWIGGPRDKLVQMGDMVDRGAQDKAVLDAMRTWQREAAEAGSEVVVLLGNHEVMNVRGLTHYVHPDAYEAFGGRKEHAAAFAPDGEYGAWLRTLPVAHVDMGTLFVHAGLLPEFAALGVDELNKRAQAEIKAGNDEPRLRRGEADHVLGVEGPVWTRKLVHRAKHGDCKLLRRTLDALKLERMVVGHTPESGGTLGDYCDTRLVVVDVGMSRWMYGNLAMLEITLPHAGTAAADAELREILPHTALQEEQQQEQQQKDQDAAGEKRGETLEEELQRDPVRLQEIFDTVRQAASWGSADDDDGDKPKADL